MDVKINRKEMGSIIGDHTGQQFILCPVRLEEAFYWYAQLQNDALFFACSSIMAHSDACPYCSGT